MHERLFKNTSEKLILLSRIEYYRKALALKRIEDSDKRYNLMLMNSPFTFAVLKGKEMIIELANERLKKWWEEEMI
jgi:two-component system CheB/CheR fusion protein